MDAERGAQGREAEPVREGPGGGVGEERGRRQMKNNAGGWPERKCEKRAEQLIRGVRGRETEIKFAEWQDETSQSLRRAECVQRAQRTEEVS